MKKIELNAHFLENFSTKSKMQVQIHRLGKIRVLEKKIAALLL